MSTLSTYAFLPVQTKYITVQHGLVELGAQSQNLSGVQLEIQSLSHNGIRITQITIMATKTVSKC